MLNIKYISLALNINIKRIVKENTTMKHVLKGMFLIGKQNKEGLV